MRVVQPKGIRGSLRWIQEAVNGRAGSLEAPILARLSRARTIAWRSPLTDDDFAEYRDGSFLRRLGLEQHRSALAAFWPARGPQWDALGVSDAGDVLLVEAKAHVGELCTPGTSAGPASRALIEQSLAHVATALGASAARAPWAETFYQLANRLAHLHFLRARGVPAWLVLANFVGDEEMGGPAHVETWHAAYHVAMHALGIPKRHTLARWIIEVFPPVASLTDRTASPGLRGLPDPVSRP